MRAWANAMQIDDKIKMLADPKAAFTKLMDMEIDMSSSLGGIRSKRYSAIVKNGVITSHNVEPTLATYVVTNRMKYLEIKSLAYFHFYERGSCGFIFLFAFPWNSHKILLWK
eukprot:Phypoly_transcript_16752.p1 GENE.Phypoly_transcript_16752~~Phypoly_transcript_16752.p1  ORF type:complete len:112 (+),score=4.17 Phypoly_transcript_16752:477-812(+)